MMCLATLGRAGGGGGGGGDKQKLNSEMYCTLIGKTDI